MAGTEVGITREIGIQQDRPRQPYQVLREAKENKLLMVPTSGFRVNKICDTALKPRLRIVKKNGVYVFNMNSSRFAENEDPNKPQDKCSSTCNFTQLDSNIYNQELGNDSSATKAQDKLKKKRINHGQCQYNSGDFAEKPKNNDKKLDQGDIKRDAKKDEKKGITKPAKKVVKRVWR